MKNLNKNNAGEEDIYCEIDEVFSKVNTIKLRKTEKDLTQTTLLQIKEEYWLKREMLYKAEMELKDLKTELKYILEEKFNLINKTVKLKEVLEDLRLSGIVNPSKDRKLRQNTINDVNSTIKTNTRELKNIDSKIQNIEELINSKTQEIKTLEQEIKTLNTEKNQTIKNATRIKLLMECRENIEPFKLYNTL